MENSPDLRQVILDFVSDIPKGAVTTYGIIAIASRLITGKGSARYVGRVLSSHGDQVPWWRVVNAKGGCAPHLAKTQQTLLEAEGHVFTDDQEPKLSGKIKWYDPLT